MAHRRPEELRCVLIRLICCHPILQLRLAVPEQTVKPLRYARYELTLSDAAAAGESTNICHCLAAPGAAD